MSTTDRFSDLRVLRWFDRIDAALAGEVVGPIRASLDLTNLCTHSCNFCEPIKFREETIRDKRHTLDARVAIDVLAELAAMDCKTINFSGGGEPTVHPSFGVVLRNAVALHMRTWVVTHGGLMHKWMDDLLLADHIRISLDASTPEEHKEMHGSHGLEYERVLQNITDLCKRRVNGSPEVGIAYIVADCNSSSDSIRRVLAFAAAAGVDFVQFRPLSEEKPQRLTRHWLEIQQDIKEISPSYNVVVHLTGKRYRDVFDQRQFETCYSALTNAVISANGDVCACCDRRDIVFGNVNQQSFKSIWLAAKHREAAEAIVPKFCGRCLQCSFNRAVEKYIVNNEALPELM